MPLADNGPLTARGRVLDGVLNEIGHKTLDEVLVAAQDEVRVMLLAQRDALVGGQGAEALHRLCDNIVEVETLVPQWNLPGVTTSQEEEVADDACEPANGLAHDLQALAVLAGLAIFTSERDVELSLEDGHGAAQLVRGVGHEATLRDERFLQPRQEGIERRGKLPQLVARIRDSDPLTEIRCAEGPGLRAHRRDRRQALARQQIPAQRADEQ